MVKTTLHEARAAAGLSICTVAEAAGVSESSYGNYEHGFYYPRPDARGAAVEAQSYFVIALHTKSEEVQDA